MPPTKQRTIALFRRGGGLKMTRDTLIDAKTAIRRIRRQLENTDATEEGITACAKFPTGKAMRTLAE